MKKTLVFVMLSGLMLTGCSTQASAQQAEPTATAAAVASITVPNVVGQTLDKATDQLKDLGLKAEAKDIDAGKSVIVKSNWQVITQDPAADAQVAKGSTVKLGVRHIVEATPTPTPTPTPSQVVVVPAEVAAPVAPPAYVPPAPAAPPAYVPPAVPEAPRYGGIICNDGYPWPGTTRQGACRGHGGIRN
ncbi:PASTA domain-containing protein [Arthrobacter sp. UYEF3]|uniref:PASTA domain-containing protein n=1 Tax=Arthrobacter sp. UYEF3 TaxID=1756365 RepID=UPI003397019A